MEKPRDPSLGDWDLAENTHVCLSRPVRGAWLGQLVQTDTGGEHTLISTSDVTPKLTPRVKAEAGRHFPSRFLNGQYCSPHPLPASDEAEPPASETGTCPRPLLL